MKKKIIALGADHGGYLLKEAIKSYFNANDISFIDFGTASESSVDYPAYALAVSKAVVKGECYCGILCCGTGIGVSIAANKVHGIRAAVCTDEFCTEMSRRHNNANVLCLGGRVIDKDKAVLLSKIFLETPFDGGRHQKRLEQIQEIENNEKIL
ncbi:MAG: Ribose-5-phosphate isomerase B [Eubacteriales bacterium SKADARSKE-1]|nr:Ribose-5-phosphate isomerase B [Eubacteriales bacterium SKADARSKE-1]